MVHDACGVGFIASLRRHCGHAIVQHGLSALRRLGDCRRRTWRLTRSRAPIAPRFGSCWRRYVLVTGSRVARRLLRTDPGLSRFVRVGQAQPVDREHEQMSAAFG